MASTVLLADDHHIFREGLKALLAQESSVSVIAEADNGVAAVERVLALKPDVAILDISMPYLNGIEAAREILAKKQGTKVIILSMHTEKEYVLEALRSGVKGFIAKNCIAMELVAAIQTVAAGEPYLSPTISAALVDGLVFAPPKSDNRLSQRESQVLRLMAEGQCTKQVASSLDLSSKTVETYRQSLMKKLNITNLANLVKYAIREGITDVA
jgi:DNA-binding NarL/FixJ family response regulator